MHVFISQLESLTFKQFRIPCLENGVTHSGWVIQLLEMHVTVFTDF